MFPASFSEQLLSLSDHPNLDPSVAQRRGRPSFKWYVERFQKYGIHEDHEGAFRFICLISLIYLEKIVEQSGEKLALKELYFRFGTAFLIASKQYLDFRYPNPYYAKVIGISYEVLSQLELLFMDEIGWNAHVAPGRLEQRIFKWNESVSKECRIANTKPVQPGRKKRKCIIL